MASMPVILATGGYDHKIKLWDATSGACTRNFLFNESQINCLDISNDKVNIVGGGNPIIHLYDTSSNDDQPVMTYEGHTSNILSIGFQNNKKWIYSGSEDGTIRIWDIRSNKWARKYDCGASVNTLALNPNQAELVSGDQNGHVKVWDLEADKCREEFLIAPDVPIRSISMACDASILTAGLHDGRIVVYNSSKKGLQFSREFTAHSDYLLKCLISPNLQMIATTSADKTIKLWDLNSFELIRSLSRHQKWVWDCVFSIDSLYLLSASSDNSAKLWDINNGDVVRNYIGHSLAVTCVALNDIALQ